jgi:hypothetical protein
VSFAFGLLTATALAGWLAGADEPSGLAVNGTADATDQHAATVHEVEEPTLPPEAATTEATLAAPVPTPVSPDAAPGSALAAAHSTHDGPAMDADPAAPGAPSPPQPGGHEVAAVPAAATGGGCVANCGEPRYFCDTWSGGFCDDFRDKASGATHVAFPAGGDPYSFDAFSTTYPQYETEGPAPADGLRAFSANEHFMTVIQDGQFGLGVLRLKQPFDFTGREGHVHFDADLKTGARRYVRFALSPDLTKVMTDDRSKQNRRPDNAFDLWFVNGRFYGSVVQGGEEVDSFFPSTTYFGTDDVRDHIDIYVTRTHVRVLVNGEQLISESVSDLGFSTAYVYLSQASYNPCKDGECDENLQMFHWDNIAFDGPALALNSLTPAGFQDVLFNAYRAESCTVADVPAEPVGEGNEAGRVTWRARLSVSTVVGVGDVVCDYNFVQDGSDRIGGFEIVRQ